MINKIYVLSIFLIAINTLSEAGKKSDHHGENVKSIDKNNVNIKTTRDKLHNFQKTKNEEFKKIQDLHNNIKTNGHNLNYKKYNELVKQYGDAVEKYNKTRKGMCAEIPPLWALKSKPNPEETIVENTCNKWYYTGRESGLIMGKALYLLGRIHFYSERFRAKRMSCYRSALFLKKGDKNTNHYRNCYLKGFNDQIYKTIDGLRENKFELLQFNNPFKPVQVKVKELKKVIRTMKNSK